MKWVSADLCLYLQLSKALFEGYRKVTESCFKQHVLFDSSQSPSVWNNPIFPVLHFCTTAALTPAAPPPQSKTPRVPLSLVLLSVFLPSFLLLATAWFLICFQAITSLFLFSSPGLLNFSNSFFFFPFFILLRSYDKKNLKSE